MKKWNWKCIVFWVYMIMYLVGLFVAAMYAAHLHNQGVVGIWLFWVVFIGGSVNYILMPVIYFMHYDIEYGYGQRNER